MKSGLTFIILSSLFSLLLAPFIIDLLYQYKIVRSRNFDDSILKIKKRKEKIGTPMMGGLIIIIPIILLTLIFDYNKYSEPALIILIAGAILGAIDDLLNIFGKKKRKVKTLKHHIRLAFHHKKISRRIYLTLTIPWEFYKSIFNSIGSKYGTGMYPHERILVQLITGAIIVYLTYFKLGIHTIWFWGQFVNIGLWLIPLIVIIIIATANAVNITDGLDGLSAGSLISAFMALFAIALIENNFSMVIFIGTVIGALITYLYFNIKPARIQMGDVGTLALGSLLATISVILKVEFILIIIGGIFVVETMTVIIQKLAHKYLGFKPFLMAPLHHHLELKGWSEEKIVMRLWLFSFALAIIGIWIFLI